MKNRYLTSLFFVVACLLNVHGQSIEGFYNINTIQSIEIEFEQDKWNYVLDSLRYNGDEMLLGDITINEQKFSKVGVRYAATRALQIGSKRNTLELVLDHQNKNQAYQGVKSIKLSIALRDPSMVREVLSYEIYRKYIPTPRANFARLNVNGEYIGLFVNIEEVDQSFLSRNFKDKGKGRLFKSAPNWFEQEPSGCERNFYASLKYESAANCYQHNFKGPDAGSFTNLIQLAKTLEEGNMDDLDAVLDIDQTLWMLALNNILVNLYSYSGRYNQNYFLYQDSKGIFHPIAGDMNLSFGSFKNVGVGSDLTLSELQKLDPLLHKNEETFPLISQLLKDPYHEKVYRSHLRTIFSDFVRNAKYLERAKALQAQIKEAFAEDPYQNYKLEDFENSLTKTIGKRSRIPGIEELMNGRNRFLSNHEVMLILPPDINEVNVEKRERFSSSKLNEFRITAKVERFPETVSIFYRFNENDAYQSMPMTDDGKHFDGEGSDEIYGAVVKPQKGATSIEYYIVAENTKALGFSPSDYVSNRHKSDLATINE